MCIQNYTCALNMPFTGLVDRLFHFLRFDRNVRQVDKETLGAWMVRKHIEATMQQIIQMREEAEI